MSSDINSEDFDFNDYIFDNNIEPPEPPVLITMIEIQVGNVTAILEMIEEEMFTGETLVTTTIVLIEHQPSLLDLLAAANEMARREIEALDVESFLEDLEADDFSSRTLDDVIQDYEASTARLRTVAQALPSFGNSLAQFPRPRVTGTDAPRITSERRNSQNLHSKFDPIYDGGELKFRNLPKANPGDVDYYNWRSDLVRATPGCGSNVIIL